jgi:hypothetical protein
MVMVMMLALMQACNQGLQSLMQDLFATDAPTPEPSHSPPGG